MHDWGHRLKKSVEQRQRLTAKGVSKMLTSEEYAAKEGGCCPKCGSKDVTGEQFDVEAGCAWQTVSCDDCDFQWDDSYKLMGFSVFGHIQDLRG